MNLSSLCCGSESESVVGSPSYAPIFKFGITTDQTNHIYRASCNVDTNKLCMAWTANKYLYLQIATVPDTGGISTTSITLGSSYLVDNSWDRHSYGASLIAVSSTQVILFYFKDSGSGCVSRLQLFSISGTTLSLEDTKDSHTENNSLDMFQGTANCHMLTRHKNTNTFFYTPVNQYPSTATDVDIYIKSFSVSGNTITLGNELIVFQDKEEVLGIYTVSSGNMVYLFLREEDTSTSNEIASITRAFEWDGTNFTQRTIDDIPTYSSVGGPADNYGFMAEYYDNTVDTRLCVTITPKQADYPSYLFSSIGANRTIYNLCKNTENYAVQMADATCLSGCFINKGCLIAGNKMLIIEGFSVKQILNLNLSFVYYHVERFSNKRGLFHHWDSIDGSYKIVPFELQ